jgi:hypothetical protein
VLSAVLLAGVAGLWVLTIAGGSASYVPQSRRFCLTAMNGALSAVWPEHAFVEPQAVDPQMQYGMWGVVQQSGSVVFYAASGLTVARVPAAAAQKTTSFPAVARIKAQPSIVIVSCPLWLPALILSAATWMLAVPVRRRRRRRRLGLCLACGYDLSGSTARCPECGAKK